MRYILLISVLCFLPASQAFEFSENATDKTLTLKENGDPLWVYNFDIKEHSWVPAKDKRRFAGCYLHPVYGLNGEILTDNAPRDHYHHHGIFWTWPTVIIHDSDNKKREYDLWTSDTELKQHFVAWKDRKTEDGKAVFSVENAWLVSGKEKVVSEIVTIVTHPIVEMPEIGKTRAIDFYFEYTPLKPMTLKGAAEKSYGGFTMRFRPKKASFSNAARIASSEGIAKEDMPEKPLSWADFSSFFGDGEDFSGAAIFIPKSHPDFPPTWLTRYYGPLCVGWPGVAGKTFPANEPIKLNYRVWIHQNSPSVEQIQSVYENWGETARVSGFVRMRNPATAKNR